jgi:protein involved in polysaccharide export with SLBB domain
MKLFFMKKQFYFVVTLIAVVMLVSITPLQAQTTVSANTMQLISNELQKRGLTENEVRTRLLQEGIDLESIPKAQLPQYQTRITTILDQMTAEKKAARNTTAQQTNLNDGSIIPTTASRDTTFFPKLKSPKTTPEEAAAEASRRAVQTAKVAKQDTLVIYGHSLFTDKSLEVFRTTDGAQAPDTYVLGEGDEIHITIFGASQTDIQQRIAPDGSIQPTGVSKIFLKGLTLAQSRDVIKKHLSSAYLFRGDQLAVTIVTARTIMVNVFGEAKITGGFNISALNSAFNALSVAGGPSAIGSVRNIQLIRGNTRKNIDLYAFMNDPAVQFKLDLQNNDIIFVPVIQKLVTIEGAVNRPMSYEILTNETLTDLFHYAGGLKMNAYPDFVQVKRFVNGEERLLEWNLAEVQSGKVKVPLMNGDIVRIKTIGKPMDQYVDVEGSVYYPGRFDLSANTSLSSLLANAKPTYEAKTDILFIDRIRPDSTVELMRVPFPNTTAGISDFKLKARDIVRIMSKANYRDLDTISVSGYVRKPFFKIVSLTENITVKQAIEMAGGLKNSVYPVAYIFRRNLFNSKEIKYIRIELNQADNIEMQAGDKLNIYDNSTYSNVGELKVFGAVKTPKGFTYDATMTIPDLLTNAGGFTIGAAYNRVEVFRTTLSPTEKVKLSMITLEVDSNYHVISPKNFSLQPFDQVVVRLTPEYKMVRTIELNGQVKYPGTYVLDSKQTRLSDVIEKAGGLLSDADPFGCTMFRTYRNRGNISMNVRDAVMHSGSNKSNPILFEGDVFNVNQLENTVSILENGTRMAQYSTHTDQDSIKNIVFQGRKSAAWYIRNFAGGFITDADRNSVTVTLPNNEMRSTKRIFFFFRQYPIVESGSMITLHMDDKKVQEKLEPKEKKDLETTVSKGLNVLMSTLSIILLLQRL